MISPAQLGELNTWKEFGIVLMAVAQKWKIDVIRLIFLVVWCTPATILLLNVHLTRSQTSPDAPSCNATAYDLRSS